MRSHKHFGSFSPSSLYPAVHSAITIVGITLVTTQLFCASPVSATDGASENNETYAGPIPTATGASPTDYCALLKGSTWDSRGYAVTFSDTTITDTEGGASPARQFEYRCSNNTLTFDDAGVYFSATLSTDGKMAVFSYPDVGAVWNLVAWSTDCWLSGQTVNNGSSINAYQLPYVPQGQKCVSESRICTDGSLSGSYPSPTCSVRPPKLTLTTAIMLVVFVLFIVWLARRHPG